MFIDYDYDDRTCALVVLIDGALLIALHFLKGKLGDFFLFVQSFYRPKTKTSFDRQFSPKSPKMGKKLGQRVQNSQNKDPTRP